MKRNLLLIIIVLVGLYLDSAFASSQLFSRVFIVPSLTVCFWLLTEQLRKDNVRVLSVILISLLYGAVTSVNVGLLAVSISLLFLLRLMLSALPGKWLAEFELLQTLGFFYLFTLGLFVINKQEVNFVVVTLVVILNSLLAWGILQLLKLALRSRSYV